jgi:hypothetical protein
MQCYCPSETAVAVTPTKTNQQQTAVTGSIAAAAAVAAAAAAAAVAAATVKHNGRVYDLFKVTQGGDEQGRPVEGGKKRVLGASLTGGQQREGFCIFVQLVNETSLTAVVCDCRLP